LVNVRGAAIEVGDRVRVRTSGGTAAARKYSGRGGRVEAIEPAFDGRRFFYVRIDGNRVETAFEEQDLVHGLLDGWVRGMGYARGR
jgi:hypothetical protein